MSTTGERYEDPGVMEVTGKVLISTIIALFVVLILVFLFHIYARWLWLRRQQNIGNNPNNNRRRQDQHSGVTVLRRGLDESFLKTLPITLHDSKDFNNEPLECSVCLTEVEQGEKTRILPKCNHAFHAECIDMWFHSHSTCPVCRNSVSEQTEEVSVESLLENNQTQEQHMSDGLDSQTSNFPTNVLFWGDETEVSTLTSQLEELEANNHLNHPQTTPSSSSSSQTNNDRFKPDLVIDIPRQMQVNEEDDEKTPILSRMRSLRRILSSSGRRFNPFSPSANNAEQASQS